MPGRSRRFCDGFGRPQGLAFDADGRLYVVEALAGASGVFRFDAEWQPAPEQLVVGGALIGVGLRSTTAALVLASSDTVYRLDVPLHGVLVDRPVAAG